MATRTVTRRADGDRLPKNLFEDRYCADGSMHPYLKPLCSLPPHLPLIQCQKDDIFTTRPPPPKWFLLNLSETCGFPGGWEMEAGRHRLRAVSLLSLALLFPTIWGWVVQIPGPSHTGRGESNMPICYQRSRMTGRPWSIQWVCVIFSDPFSFAIQVGRAFDSPVSPV